MKFPDPTVMREMANLTNNRKDVDLQTAQSEAKEMGSCIEYAARSGHYTIMWDLRARTERTKALIREQLKGYTIYEKGNIWTISWN